MFNGHQVALGVRRVSSQDVLSGVVGTSEHTLFGELSSLKPHYTIRLANWGHDAKEAEWRMVLRG